ncbi:MAG: two-component regulator propeller domain-containing protein, partial [Planctomycetota bacterium]|nr:two-component regulator propeller domain-containing protein [Planctomycetota bacterium]
MRLRPPYLLHLLAIVVGVVTLSANAVSQRYLVHTYGELDGLPSGRIADIAQDAAGRIWFATRQHLASYDGYEWSTPLFAAGMGPQTMERVLVDDLDRVWALPAKAKNRVICRIDGSWRQLPLLPDLDMASGQLPWTAATTWTGPQGTELLGTIGGVHSYRCAGASWQPLVWPAELRDATITDIEQAGSALFVATTSGLYRVDAEFRTASLVPGTGESRILGLGRDPTNETVWVLADPWLGRVSGSELHIAVEDLGISGQAASYYEGPIVDRLGGVLVGAMRHVLRYDPRGSVEPITRANGLAKEGATGLLCDREGNVWVGSVGWASKLVDLRFATADAEHGLLETEVTALVQRADGTYAVGHPTGITLVPDLQAFGSRQQHRLQHIQLDVPLDPAHRLLDLEERADGT